MPIAHDADPWVRPPLRNQPTSIYGIQRDGPGPQEDYSFADLLDIINPLQHIPLVSSVYRALTGDEIKPSARILGATLYGGPVGLVASTSMAVVQEAAGGSPTDMMVASLLGTDEAAPAEDSTDFAAAQAEEGLSPASGPAPATAPAPADQAPAGPLAPRPTSPVAAPPAGPIVAPTAQPLVPAQAGRPAAPPPAPAPAAGAATAADDLESPPRAAPYVPVESQPLATGQLPAPQAAPAASVTLPRPDGKSRDEDGGTQPAADAVTEPEFAARFLEGYNKYERLMNARKDGSGAMKAPGSPGN